MTQQFNGQAVFWRPPVEFDRELMHPEWARQRYVGLPNVVRHQDLTAVRRCSCCDLLIAGPC